MLLIRPYGRERAVTYAERWAFSQNPLFSDFDMIGGNCTNFVSQCLLAGTCQMNFLPVYGWYYLSLNERSPSWTGVPFLYNFLVGNTGVGPFGREAGAPELELGDVVQLGRTGEGFYHSLLVVGFEGEEILVAAQSEAAFRRPLSSYTFDTVRCIKIEGVRLRVPSSVDCFEGLYRGLRLFPSEEPLPEEEPPAESEEGA